MEWLEIIKVLTPIASLYIAYLTYRMNNKEIIRKRNKELEEQKEKDVPLPPRSKRPKP